MNENQTPNEGAALPAVPSTDWLDVLKWTVPSLTQQGDVDHHRLVRVRALLMDRCEEVTNNFNGVIGYQIYLDIETTTRVFEIIDGIGTHSKEKLSHERTTAV